MKFLTLSLVPLLTFGCGNSSGGGSGGTPDMAMATLGPAPALAMPCSDAVTGLYTRPSTLPAMDDTHRGDVFHCAVTESLTAARANQQIDGFTNAATTSVSPANFVPGHVVSGFWTYRVAYRSTRNTVNGMRAEGDMAAYLVVPEKPIAGAPLVVFSHGSNGVAPKCAPSRTDLSAAVADRDYPVSIMRLAGYGYTVIAPDYAGYSYDQGPVGYFNAEDEAHAVLDATRAAANLLPSPPDKVVIFGHSQGGHAALAAQSYAKQYGMKGTLVGVSVFAPLWTSMALWAAATTPAAGLHNDTDTSSVLYSMEYNYAAGELRNPGHGLDVFQPAKQQAAKDAMYGGECYDTAKVAALGATPADFYDTTFVSNTGFNCAANTLAPDCTMAPSPTWMTRWQEDRPKLDDQSAPILVFYGGMDATVKPGWAECARERFMKDLSAGGATTMIKFCYDANAQHRDIIRGADPDYVNQWIAARAGLGPEPAACADFPTGLSCLTPPNDL